MTSHIWKVKQKGKQHSPRKTRLPRKMRLPQERLQAPPQACATHGSQQEATVELTETYYEFLEQKNAGDAKGYFQYQLESIKVSNFIPCQLLVSDLHKGYFFWHQNDLPSNFSIFLCRKPMPISSTTLELITFSMNLKMEMDWQMVRSQRQWKKGNRFLEISTKPWSNYKTCTVYVPSFLEMKWLWWKWLGWCTKTS